VYYRESGISFLKSLTFRDTTTINMTLSTPIKIIVACFAVAALVNSAMFGGSASGGLKGSARKLQGSQTKPAFSIFANLNSFFASFNTPAPVAFPIKPATFPITGSAVAIITPGGIFASAGNGNAAAIITPVTGTGVGGIVSAGNGAAIIRTGGGTGVGGIATAGSSGGSGFIFSGP
jgi:hypothetical protein